MIDKYNWITVYPDLLLLLMACVIAMIDLGVKTPRRTGTYVLTLVTLAVAGNVKAGTSTDDGTEARASKARCSAAVPELTAAAKRRPQ